ARAVFALPPAVGNRCRRYSRHAGPRFRSPRGRWRWRGRCRGSPGDDADNPLKNVAHHAVLPPGLALGPLRDEPAEEVAHEPSNQVPFAFQREVAGVEQVELYRLEVSLVRLGPGRREDLVVLAPHNQHRWLVLPEVILPLRVEWRVTPVTQKQVELDLV